jgi:hypothetical protein
MVAPQQQYSEEQLSQLLLRLAEAPDLSLFRDKWERLDRIEVSFYVHMSEQLLLQLAAALSRGLMLLVPLLLLDLPKRALYSIRCLQRVIGGGQLMLDGQVEPEIQAMPMCQVVDNIAGTGESMYRTCSSSSSSHLGGCITCDLTASQVQQPALLLTLHALVSVQRFVHISRQLGRQGPIATRVVACACHTTPVIPQPLLVPTSSSIA